MTSERWAVDPNTLDEDTSTDGWAVDPNTIDKDKLGFEWTPRIEELLRRGHNTSLHPSLNVGHDRYEPHMELPAEDDIIGIMKWLGCNEAVSAEIKQEYDEMVANDSPELIPTKFGKTRDLMGILVRLFVNKKWAESMKMDPEETFEGHVNALGELGLQPEFAVICVVYPDWILRPIEERERWSIYDVGQPGEMMCELVSDWASTLKGLWNDKGYFDKGLIPPPSPTGIRYHPGNVSPKNADPQNHES
ncbi:hypothetical protein SBOR_2739 [Sclerotinia borealis F-4128]|uniref:Uncharacterized protein n=1 Tax=Sclerotinia borealis (strain F-4128) TaxID=1432307 RepID=W9CQJ2_SCLBF|nr:hypothetical protein SBOR_2739 [Sclerotinia borealis F-4128]